MVKILIVEDDASFGYILKEYLTLNGYETTLVKDGDRAIKEVEKSDYALCLLDIMLPKLDGFTVAKNIRDNNPDLPFIFITAKALKVDKLKGFHLGCDDYIVKPIDEELLLARIKAIILRTNRNQRSSEIIDKFILGDIQFDVKNQYLNHNENKIFLTERESLLLRMLCENQNTLLPRKKALKEIWGSTDEFSRKSMDVFIFKLRKYLSSDPTINIRNIHGRGFILEIKN